MRRVLARPVMHGSSLTGEKRVYSCPSRSVLDINPPSESHRPCRRTPLRLASGLRTTFDRGTVLDQTGSPRRLRTSAPVHLSHLICSFGGGANRGPGELGASLDGRYVNRRARYRAPARYLSSAGHFGVSSCPPHLPRLSRRLRYDVYLAFEQHVGEHGRCPRRGPVGDDEGLSGVSRPGTEARRSCRWL